MTFPKSPSDTEAEAIVVNATLHASKACLNKKGNLKRMFYAVANKKPYLNL